MAVPWGLVALLVGLLYGYLKPGRQDKWAMLKKGAVIGILLAVVFTLLGALLNLDPLGLGAGFVGIVLAVLVLTILFVVGAWLGDMLEGAPKRG